MDLGRAITAIGLAVTAVGLWIAFGPRVPWLGWLGHLPGDLHLQRGGFEIWLPITSCIVVSAALTVVLYVVGLLVRR